jgi:hypothetical protein
MSNVNFVQQLLEQVELIEASARAFDAGNKDAANQIARSLRAIFHQTASSNSLLAEVRGRFIRLLTSVEKPPYPQDWYSPMAEIEGKFHFPAIHVGAQPSSVKEPPRFRPMLESKKLTRQVQAPDWWGNEPALIEQGKKVTRKVIVLRASDEAGGGPTTNADHAHAAVLRQMAYEVLKSAELMKLAGR